MKLGSAVSVTKELLSRLSYEEEHDLVKHELLTEFSRSMIDHFEDSVSTHTSWQDTKTEFVIQLHIYTEAQHKRLRRKLNELMGPDEAKRFFKEKLGG